MSGAPVRTFDVIVPAEARGQPLRLYFDSVTVPANRSFELEVSIKDRSGRDRVVGFLSFIATSLKAKGTVSDSPAIALPPLHALELSDVSRMRIRVRPIDASSRLIEDLAWDVKAVALEAR